MKQGAICIYSGDGHGKSPAALGEAVLTAAAGGSVVIIQFLKGKELKDTEFIHRLVRPPQYAGVSSGKDQKADRPGPA